VEADWTHEDLAKSSEARKQVARSLAIFSAFAEGVSLYSSFAVLYSFQMRNLLKGIGQQMKWSVRDESLHSRMGCQLFRHMCEEYPELKEEVKDDVIRAAELMVEMEHKFINKMFEMGDLENLKADDLKHFIVKRANEKIAELGYDGPFIEFDEDKASELDWFYHLTGGTTHTDFFAIRPTDYSKAGEDENWDEDDIF
jgi:ribonucleoside-diphosphate reductase beta chain